MTDTPAIVVADSLSPTGVRLTTLQLRFPTCILPQVRTYGSLAFSVRSLRAVRTETLASEVEADPFVPAVWRRAKKGMVAGERMAEADAARAAGVWRAAGAEAVRAARALDGAAKEHANRLLAPFTYSVAAVTGTDDAWLWLIHQRQADDAQPEFQALAGAIRDARAASTPALLRAGEWHLPYVPDAPAGVPDAGRRYGFASAARCARVSYGPPPTAGGTDYSAELAMGHRLLGDRHLGPFEHAAMACDHLRHLGKHRGWLSLRASLGY